MKTLTVVYKNGRTTRELVDDRKVTSVFHGLNFDLIRTFHWEEETRGQEVKPGDVDFSYIKAEDKYLLSLHDPDNKRIAFVKYDPVKFQQFALNLIQQTTYHLRDVTQAKDELQFRMDGLDK